MRQSTLNERMQEISRLGKKLSKCVNDFRSQFSSSAEVSATVFIQGTQNYALSRFPGQRKSSAGRRSHPLTLAEKQARRARRIKREKYARNVLNSVYTTACHHYLTQHTSLEPEHLFPPILNMPGPGADHRLVLNQQKVLPKGRLKEQAIFGTERSFKEYFPEILLHVIREASMPAYLQQLRLARDAQARRKVAREFHTHTRKMGKLLYSLALPLWELYVPSKKQLRQDLDHNRPSNTPFAQALRNLGDVVLGSQQLNMHLAGFSRGAALSVFTANLLSLMAARDPQKLHIKLAAFDPATGPNHQTLLYERLPPNLGEAKIVTMEKDRTPFFYRKGAKLRNAAHGQNQLIQEHAFDGKHSDVNIIRTSKVHRPTSKIAIGMVLRMMENFIPTLLPKNATRVAYSSNKYKGQEKHLDYSTEKTLDRMAKQMLPFESSFRKKNIFFPCKKECVFYHELFQEKYPHLFILLRYLESGQRTDHELSPCQISTFKELLDYPELAPEIAGLEATPLLKRKLFQFLLDYFFRHQTKNEQGAFKALEKTLNAITIEKMRSGVRIGDNLCANPYGLTSKDLQIFVAHKKIFGNLESFIHIKHEFSEMFYPILEETPDQMRASLLRLKALPKKNLSSHVEKFIKGLERHLKELAPSAVAQPSQSGLFRGSLPEVHESVAPRPR